MAVSVFFIAFFIFEIILYAFNFSMLILMAAERKTNFKGPFFTVFRIVLFADVLTFLAMVFYKKLSLIPFITEYLLQNSIWATWLSIVLNFLSVTQFFGHFFLALNRFTLIWFPLNHDNIWKRQWYTVVVLGLSCMSIIRRINASVYFVFTADYVVGVVFTDKDVALMNSVISTVINFSSTCFAAIFNFLAFVKFFIRKQNNSALHVNKKSLLYVSLIIFVTQFLRVLYNANASFFPTNAQLKAFFDATLPILSDIFAWSGSISLMILSSSTRKAYKLVYFSNSRNKVINASNPSAPKMFTIK